MGSKENFFFNISKTGVLNHREDGGEEFYITRRGISP